VSAEFETVKTMADLKTKPISSLNTTISVQVLGYYRPGGGGGGFCMGCLQ
jgi:hypothetical protein